MSSGGNSNGLIAKYIGALSSFLIAKPYEVDYNQPVVEICKKLVQFCITQSDPTRALDILCRCWAPSPVQSQNKDDPETWPSWIQTVRGSAFGFFSHPGGITKSARKNADSVVGLPIQSSYSAAGGRGLEPIPCRFKRRQGCQCMFVTGFVIGKVDRLEVASQGGLLPSGWLKLSG